MPETVRSSDPQTALRKGERTAQRLLDAAERLFADRGFEGTSLRAVADAAGLKEPGIYNHFDGKQALYSAVLERALGPMLTELAAVLEAPAPRDGTPPENQRQAATQDPTRRAIRRLPRRMTDLLAEHPRVASLFHQALQGDAGSLGNRMMTRWLDRLFRDGPASRPPFTTSTRAERSEAILRIIAVFNLTTGYFLAGRVMESLGAGDPLAEANLERQKILLDRLVQTAFAPTEPGMG